MRPEKPLEHPDPIKQSPMPRGVSPLEPLESPDSLVNSNNHGSISDSISPVQSTPSDSHQVPLNYGQDPELVNPPVGGGKVARIQVQSESPNLTNKENEQQMLDVEAVMTTSRRFEQYLRNAHPKLTEDEVMRQVERAMKDKQFRKYLQWRDEMDEQIIQAHPEWNWQRWYEEPVPKERIEPQGAHKNRVGK